MARPKHVREVTGFAIGGIPPVGHAQRLTTIVEARLLRLDGLWAAAGHPHYVFTTTFDELVRITGGTPTDVGA